MDVMKTVLDAMKAKGNWQFIIINFILVWINDWLKGQDLKTYIDSGIDEAEELVEKQVSAECQDAAKELLKTVREKLDIPDYPDI